MTDETRRITDLVELHALCSRYMLLCSQLIGNMPVVDLDGDRATGKQHFVSIDQTTHAMRLCWYNDEYQRTADGWRIRRSTSFMRKHGVFDSGAPHDPLADAEEAR